MIDRRDMLKVSSVAAATAIMEGANLMANGAPLATDYAGVREYIGARYVPLFANPLEWSNQREYEPLTIVVWQGNSYTSTQYVPTGIDIGNTEFWALTGNYNAQVEGYRQEVLKYAETVETFDERITSNTNDISAINNQIKQKTMLAFGDSYGVSPITDGPLWHTVCAEKLGLPQPTVYCVSGATFNTSQNNNVQAQIDLAITEVEDKEHVGYIGIIAGVNDGETAITTPIQNCIATLQENFPNAIIAIGLNAGYNEIVSLLRKTKRINAVRLNGTLGGRCYIDSFAFITMAQGTLKSDKLHPTTLGSNLLGTQMTLLLQGGINTSCIGFRDVDPIYLTVANLDSQYGYLEDRKLIMEFSVNAASAPKTIPITPFYPANIPWGIPANGVNTNPLVGGWLQFYNQQVQLRIAESVNTGSYFSGYTTEVI